MLEDHQNDILNKACRAQGLTPEDLAARTEIDLVTVNELLGSLTSTSPLLQKLANTLALDAQKLLNLKNYHPRATLPLNLHQLTTPFRSFDVNAYFLDLPEHQLIFDTGTDISPVLELIDQKKELHLFITHNHIDHCGKRSTIQEHCHCTLHESTTAPNTLNIGGIQIQSLNVSGHFTPALAYYFNLNGTNICILGDCLFAGSIGKCATFSTYKTALANIRENIFSLPTDTILCPGHGPCTTIAQEIQFNPFFPD